MKNLVRNMLAVMILGVVSMSASANKITPVPIYSLSDTIVADTVKKEVLLVQNEMIYSRIEISEIPRSIKSTVAYQYAAYAIEEAYRDADYGYKLILKREDQKMTVFYNEAGEYLREEAGNRDKVVFMI